jgi:hypothetical protein
MCLQFGFVIFWQKDFGAKAAHKILVKLTACIPDTLCNFYLVENDTTAKNSATTKAREKISTDLESLEFS